LIAFCSRGRSCRPRVEWDLWWRPWLFWRLGVDLRGGDAAMHRRGWRPGHQLAV